MARKSSIDKFFEADDNLKYIHYHKKKVIDGIEGKKIPDLKKALHESKIQLKKDYKNNLVASIKNGAEVFEKIGATMQRKEDQLLKAIDESVYETLNQGLNLTGMKDLSNQNLDLNNLLKDCIDNNNVDQFNALIRGLGEITKIIEGADAPLTAMLLNFEKTNQTIKGQSKALKNELDKVRKQYNGKSFKEESLKSAIGTLQQIANAFNTKQFQNKNELTVEGMKTLISNIFISEKLGETVGFLAKNEAEKLVVDAINRTGTASVSSDFYGRKITGKTDTLLQGLKINLSSGDQSADLKINVGLSEKLYRGQAFLNNQGEDKLGTFSSGSGGSLIEAINTIFKSPNDRYYAYNYSTFRDKGQESAILEQFQAIIATRQFLRAISSAGAGDFASFILVNGELISVLKLMNNYVLNNKDLGKSSSMGGKNPVEITLRGRKTLIDKSLEWSGEGGVPSLEEAKNRSEKVNKAIYSVRVHMKIHMDRMKNAINKF